MAENPNWCGEANQLPIYKDSHGVDPGTTENNGWQVTWLRTRKYD